MTAAELAPAGATAHELAELRAAVRDVAAAFGAPGVVRTLAGGVHAEAWRVLAEEVGIAGLGLPAACGGLGGLPELAAVCEELGRSLLPVPFLGSTVLAGQVLAGCGAADALQRVAAGAVFGLGVTGPEGTWSPAGVPVTARRGASGWVLDGTARFVLDGPAAEAFVVAAGGPEGVDVFLVERADVAMRVVPVLDLSRGQAELTFAGSAARRLTADGAGAGVVDRALDVALVALAAEQLGGAHAALDLTVGYVRMRRQFGRELGSFQAVKHRCADLLVQVEFARSAVQRAVEAEAGSRAEAAAVAQAWCSEAFVVVAGETVHLHGGIGFTWEHDAHLYFRRARADAVAFGTAAHHRERLAALLDW